MITSFSCVWCIENLRFVWNRCFLNTENYSNIRQSIAFFLHEIICIYRSFSIMWFQSISDSDRILMMRLHKRDLFKFFQKHSARNRRHCDFSGVWVRHTKQNNDVCCALIVFDNILTNISNCFESDRIWMEITWLKMNVKYRPFRLNWLCWRMME